MNFFDRRGKPVVKPSEKTVEDRLAAYGIHLKDKKILMVRTRPANRWELPGGGLRKSETVADGLKREFTEETGFGVIDFLDQPIMTSKQNFYADDLDQFFNAKASFYVVNQIEKIENSPPDPGEIKEMAWVDPKDLSQKNCPDYHLRAIKRFLDR
jgi:8-oxo-dGTP pyrophosphatase MutT (NUDIX family)